MRPSNAVLDSADGALSDAIFFRENFLLFFGLSNGLHLFECQFSGAALFATIRRSVLYAFVLIGGWRVPSKIAKPVVEWVAIIVATLTTTWRGAAKGQQYKPARATELVNVIFPEQQKRPVSLFVGGQCFDVPCFGGSNATSIRYFIDAFKTDNVFPLFHKAPISQDMGIFYHGQ